MKCIILFKRPGAEHNVENHQKCWEYCDFTVGLNLPTLILPVILIHALQGMAVSVPPFPGCCWWHRGDYLLLYHIGSDFAHYRHWAAGHLWIGSRQHCPPLMALPADWGRTHRTSNFRLYLFYIGPPHSCPCNFSFHLNFYPSCALNGLPILWNHLS